MLLKKSVNLLLILLFSATSACAPRFDAADVRNRHAETFSEELAERTGAAIPDEALGLAGCIRIALENNLDLEQARINRRLAELDRKIAFSYFMPQVSVQTVYASMDQQPTRIIGGMPAPVSDRTLTETIITAQQGVFIPQTWFLYEAFKGGEDISEWVRQRTRAQIRLQVTALYFAALSYEAAGEAIAAGLDQARSVLEETESLAFEGLVMPSHAAQVRALVRAQEATLARNTRILKETKSALLEAMGVSPAAILLLKAETPIVIEDADLPDQILEAMLNRPELFIADRTIDVHKQHTRMAIARFLPDIIGFASFTHTTDSFLKYGNSWMFGAAGVLSVFEGFRNINEYKAAGIREDKARIQREQAFLRIMFEVILARSRYDQAVEDYEVADYELTAARLLMMETDARWYEGLLLISGRMDPVTRHAAARANLAVADFQKQVAAATLLDVMGRSVEEEDV
jgi:outer membrane protein TolC